MAGKSLNIVPDTITIAPRGTGSFDEIGLFHTPFVSLTITKLTDKNSLDTISLQRTDVQDEWSGRPGAHPPSGSTNDFYWYNDPSWSVSPGGIASGAGGVSGSVFSGSVAATPFTTGSAVGSVTFQGQVNSRWVRIELRSNSGGRFKLTGTGKE